jgi:hypothetical protein
LKKVYVFIAVLCSVIFSACLSSWDGEEGTITIRFAPVSRVAVEKDEIPDITHEITLTGPGGVITETITGDGSVTFSLIPGRWTINIRAIGDTPAAYNDQSPIFPNRMLRALGEDSENVYAGLPAYVNVNMISAVEVETHEQFIKAIEVARTDGREKIIVINEDIEADGIYTINLNKRITLSSDKDVTISRGTGNTGNMIDVTNGIFTIGRPGMKGSVTLDGASASTVTNSIIRVSGASSTCYLNNGAILENNNSNMGGGVRVEEDGELFLDGGIIRNNSASSGGGGVYLISRGTFTMVSGTIGDNKAYNGGGVFTVTSAGIFIMDGGYIEGNEAESPPGNATPGIGGGVRAGNNITINEGIIRNNISEGAGGGVSIVDGAIFEMNGGTIENNTSEESGGGGVHIGGAASENTTLNMHDGYIRGNTAGTSGGGVFIGANGFFNMNGGEITGNTATGSGTAGGGGVFVNGTFMKNTGFIDGYGSGNDLTRNKVENDSGIRVGRGHAVFVSTPTMRRKEGDSPLNETLDSSNDLYWD